MTLTMSREEREQFLAGVHVGVVSIPRKDKGPLTVPIWYDYEPGGDVWMITGRSSIKGRLLNRVDRISLCAQSETAPYQYVSVEGPITMRETDDAELLQMAVRYLGEEQGSEAVTETLSKQKNFVVSPNVNCKFRPAAFKIGHSRYFKIIFFNYKHVIQFLASAIKISSAFIM